MPGSFSEVIKEYLAELPTMKRKNGKDLSESIRYRRKLELELVGQSLGSISVDLIKPSLIQAHLDEMKSLPGKQTAAREALKALEVWAIVRDKLPHQITLGTQAIGSESGHEPWTDEEIESAIANARPDLGRVVSLAVNTGQRGSDVVRMRWSDIEEIEGRQGINVTQQKTGKRLWIPITGEFGSKISKWERRPPFFLVLAPDGRPFTRNRLSHDWANERDSNPLLSAHKERGLVLHGLRGSAVVRLRNMGFTDLEIASYTGMSPPMVARYSRLADQKKMALATVERIENFRNQKNKTLQTKPLKFNDPTL